MILVLLGIYLLGFVWAIGFVAWDLWKNGITELSDLTIMLILILLWPILLYIVIEMRREEHSKPY